MRKKNVFFLEKYEKIAENRFDLQKFYEYYEKFGSRNIFYWKFQKFLWFLNRARLHWKFFNFVKKRNFCNCALLRKNWKFKYFQWVAVDGWGKRALSLKSWKFKILPKKPCNCALLRKIEKNPIFLNEAQLHQKICRKPTFHFSLFREKVRSIAKTLKISQQSAIALNFISIYGEKKQCNSALKLKIQNFVCKRALSTIFLRLSIERVYHT